MLDPARDVLADQTSNHLTVEDAPPARPLTENQLRHDAAPPTAKPRPHRNGKPHLGTSEDARGQDAFHAVSQYSFRGGPLKLQAGRETGGEFDELVLEKGHPALDRSRHAHLVLLHQQLMQVGLDVDVE